MYLPVPPLRERPEDIEPLLDHFTSYYSKRYGIRPIRLTPEWRARFRGHDWPENVRELQAAAAAFVAQAAQSLK